MARSNQNDFLKIITPISNARYFKVQLNAKLNAENMECECYYKEPLESDFPDQESYIIAKNNFIQNEIGFKNAQDRGLLAMVFNDGAKKYHHDLTVKSEKNNNSSFQFISGRLLNFYSYTDTHTDGKTPQKFVADLFDFNKNERYEITFSIAVIGRKFIDKICSLTSNDLENGIVISLNRYIPKGAPKSRVDANVYVLDKNEKYGKREVVEFYEKTFYDTNIKKSTALPQGSPSNNEEFLEALSRKIEDGSDKRFVKFYKRIAFEFQTNVLKPCVEKMFNEMGWKMEIKDEMKDKKLLTGATINEKVREVIYLTPINAQSSDVQEKSSDDSHPDELPF